MINVVMWKEKEYLELLESIGVDTVCFMGSGYEFDDYLVGQEFYFPYAYQAIDAKMHDGFNIKDAVIVSEGYHERLITDRYKLVKKYEFVTNKLFGNKMRVERCLIENVRTKEVTHLRDKEVDRFHWLLMAEPK